MQQNERGAGSWNEPTPSNRNNDQTIIAGPRPSDDPVERVLSRLDGVKKTANGWEASCPAHDDRHPSLCVTRGQDERVLLHCQAGCEQEAVTAAVGLTMHDLFPTNGRAARERPPIVATYDYIDDGGKPVFQVVRFDPKGFRQRRPDGRGGWTWNLNGVRRVLFHLPQLLAADLAMTVYVVEGEKDVLALERFGLVATTNPGGAGKWRDEYAEQLRGRHVVIVPDNDDVGRGHGDQVARSLAGIATSTRIVTLPGAPEKGDVSDWLTAGGTREALEALAAAAPLPTIGTGRAASTLITAADLLAEPDEAVAWMVDGLLPAGGSSLLIAKPKVGKSTMARALAMAVANGEPFLGRHTTAGAVIYLALEEKKQNVKDHLGRLGASCRNLYLHFGAVPPGDAVAWLRERIVETGATLVVIDTLGRFVQARDLNDYAEGMRRTDPIISLVRDTGAHIVCLHHEGKGDRTGIDTGIGSIAWAGTVDSVLILKRNQANARTLATIQRTGEDLAETAVTLDRESGTVSLGALPVEEARLKDTIEKVVAAVREGAGTEEQVREACGGNSGLTGEALRAAYRQGLVHRGGRGIKGHPFYYYVTETGKREKRENGNPVESENARFLVSSFPPPRNEDRGDDPELTEAKRCHACRGEDFWTQSPGFQVCSRCHPPCGLG